MTDEELERLANAVIALDGGTYGHAGATKLGRGVLALLERVRKAESQSEKWRAMLKDAQRYGSLLDQMLPTVIGRGMDTDALIRGYGDAIEALQQDAVASRRAGLETALRLAEDVEREETSLGNAITASAAEEVKDRIKERIRWLDEGTE